jgi:hypothetical protein
MKQQSTYDKIHDKYQKTSNKKQGVKYERLAALVFKSLEKQGVIIHDKKLKGKSGVPHQIDVIAEDKDGEKRRIMVECKDFDIRKKKHVGIEIVRNFLSVINEQEPKPEGIIISCDGFSRDAIKFATYYKIKLGILRQITDEDLEGRITKISIDFQYKSTPEAFIRLLFADMAIQEEFKRCLRENDINDISLSDSGVFFEMSNGEINSVKEFVNANVDKYIQDNPTEDYGIILVDLSGSHIKVKDVALFPINEVEISFMCRSYSAKLESYSERVAEMIYKILGDKDDNIIFADDLECLRIDPKTHEVIKNPEIIEISGWDNPIVKGMTMTWMKKIDNAFLQIEYSKDKATKDYVTKGLIIPPLPQEQWIIKDGRIYIWGADEEDWQRLFSGEFIDKSNEMVNVINEDISTPQKMAAYLEKTAANLSQPLPYLILWILGECNGKMENNRLKMFTGKDFPILKPILRALEKEGKIKIVSNIILLI